MLRRSDSRTRTGRTCARAVFPGTITRIKKKQLHGASSLVPEGVMVKEEARGAPVVEKEAPDRISSLGSVWREKLEQTKKTYTSCVRSLDLLKYDATPLGLGNVHVMDNYDIAIQFIYETAGALPIVPEIHLVNSNDVEALVTYVGMWFFVSL
jgi:hypothetical protein